MKFDPFTYTVHLSIFMFVNQVRISWRAALVTEMCVVLGRTVSIKYYSPTCSVSGLFYSELEKV